MKKPTKSNKYKPTTAQNKLLVIMLNPNNRFLSITAICKEARCNRATYYKAFNNPKFVAYYKAKSKDLVDQAIMPVVNALIKNAKAGSQPHIKMVLEMSDMHTEKKVHQLTGKDGGPIETKQVNMSQEEIEKEMKEKGIPIPE